MRLLIAGCQLWQPQGRPRFSSGFSRNHQVRNVCKDFQTNHAKTSIHHLLSCLLNYWVICTFSRNRVMFLCFRCISLSGLSTAAHTRTHTNRRLPQKRQSEPVFLAAALLKRGVAQKGGLSRSSASLTCLPLPGRPAVLLWPIALITLTQFDPF